MILNELYRNSCTALQLQRHNRLLSFVASGREIKVDEKTALEAEFEQLEVYTLLLQPWEAAARKQNEADLFGAWEEAFGMELGSDEESESSRRAVEYLQQSSKMTPEQEYDLWLDSVQGVPPDGQRR